MLLLLATMYITCHEDKADYHGSRAAYAFSRSKISP